MIKRTREDYLITIYSICEVGGNEVSSVDVARKLGVTKPTVSRAVKSLTDEGFVSSGFYSKISLTKKGLRGARRMMYRHRLIEMFLIKKLGYGVDELRGVVHDEAHRLEHVFSDESIKRIDKMLRFPKRTVSGKEIPRGSF